MDYKELREKIEHARSLDRALPPLPYQDIREMIRQQADNNSNYLVYVNENEERTELSYAEFCREVTACARFLQYKGLRQGDRIATVSHNHFHTVIQYFAAWLIGLVVVPVNLDEGDEHIANVLENGNIELAFIRTDYRKRFRKILESYDVLKHIEWIICEDTTDNFTKEEGELDLPDGSMAESEALVAFSSAINGEPKAAVLSQRNLLEEARSIVEWHGMDSKTRMMCVLPLHHVNSTVVTILTPFYAGGSTILNQEFRADRFFPVVKEEEVHIVNVVPTLLEHLNNYYSDKDSLQCPSLKHIICGSGSLTVNVAETFEERFDIPVIHGYGLSEATCFSSFMPIDLDSEEHQKWLTDFDYPSIGLPVPANEMAIHDENGKDLPEKERGEIVIRGVNVMLGYSNNRKTNEKAFKHGWFRSGQEGFYINDDNGRPYFFVTGHLSG